MFYLSPNGGVYLVCPNRIKFRFYAIPRDLEDGGTSCPDGSDDIGVEIVERFEGNPSPVECTGWLIDHADGYTPFVAFQEELYLNVDITFCLGQFNGHKLYLGNPVLTTGCAGLRYVPMFGGDSLRDLLNKK